MNFKLYLLPALAALLLAGGCATSIPTTMTNATTRRVTPEHKVTLPFTRLLCGPADFTPGGFLNRQPADFQSAHKSPQVQGTRAAELALFVIYDSPVGGVCDRPDHILGQPGSEFLKIVPTVWEETRVLDAAVAHHLVIARRAADGRWFIAGLTDGQAREIQVDLSFLGRGHWKLSLWHDDAASDVNAEALKFDEREVTPGDKLNVRLSPGGGFAGELQEISR